jgi:hypothetical protein
MKTLRFGPGERVNCDIGRSDYRWSSGTIIAINFREQDWEPGQVAACQIQLDRGALVFCHADNPAHVRACGSQPVGLLPLIELNELLGDCRPPLGHVGSF